MKLCEFEKARFDAMAYFALKIYELNKLQNYPNATAILRGLKIIFESNKNKYQ
jgi:hypothetical protein